MTNNSRLTGVLQVGTSKVDKIRQKVVVFLG
jgi:hypothetical protein